MVQTVESYNDGELMSISAKHIVAAFEVTSEHPANGKLGPFKWAA